MAWIARRWLHASRKRMSNLAKKSRGKTKRPWITALGTKRHLELGRHIATRSAVCNPIHKSCSRRTHHDCNARRLGLGGTIRGFLDTAPIALTTEHLQTRLPRREVSCTFEWQPILAARMVVCSKSTAAVNRCSNSYTNGAHLFGFLQDLYRKASSNDKNNAMATWIGNRTKLPAWPFTTEGAALEILV